MSAAQITFWLICNNQWDLSMASDIYSIYSGTSNSKLFLLLLVLLGQ